MADVLLEPGSQEVERDVLLEPFSEGAAPRPAAGIRRRRLGACCLAVLVLVIVSQLVLAARPRSCEGGCGARAGSPNGTPSPGSAATGAAPYGAPRSSSLRGIQQKSFWNDLLYQMGFDFGGGGDQARAPLREGELEVTILHINDHHSHISESEFSVDFGGDDVEVSVGGFAMVGTLVRELEANVTNPIKIHAGDAITGSHYFSMFRGAAAADAMNTVCFDSLTLGNHEFDKGDSGLASFVDELHKNKTGCQTPIISANFVAGPGSPLKGKVSPYTIKQFGNQSVAIVGLSPSGKIMNGSSPDDGTLITDEKTAAQSTIDNLTAAGYNKIIFASHIGYDGDLKMASELRGVDIIIGGDSHTLLGKSDGVGKISTPQGPYPTETVDADGKKVCVVQAWEYAKLVGQLSVRFDAEGVVTSCSGSPKVPFDVHWQHAENADAVKDFLEDTGEFVDVTPDADISYTLDEYTEEIDSKFKKIIGSAPEVLCLERIPGMGHSSLCDVSETWKHGSLIGQVCAHAFLMAGPPADFTILNAGSVRKDLDKGDIELGNIYEVLPFGDVLVTLHMTGAQIKQVLEDVIATAFDSDAPSTGAYPLAAGLRFDVDASQPVNSRVSNMEVNSGLSNVWVPLDTSQNYKVRATKYQSKGKDGYTLMASVPVDYHTTEYAKALTDYVKSKGTLVVPPESEFGTQKFVSHKGIDHSVTPPEGGEQEIHGKPPEE